MVFLVFDASDTLRCISESWPIARSALDSVVAEDDGLPRLEIHASAVYGI